MVTTIEACACNIDADCRDALAATSATARIYPCLDHCGICHRHPFLVLDGVLQQGNDHEAILEEASTG